MQAPVLGKSSVSNGGGEAKPGVPLAVAGGVVSPISSGGLIPSNAAQVSPSLSFAAAASNVSRSSGDHEAALASSDVRVVVNHAAYPAAKRQKTGTHTAEDISKVGNKRPRSEDQAENPKNKQARSQ